VIGWGSPNKQGTEATHGAALGEAEVAATRKHIDWPYEPFVVPDEIRSAWDARAAGAKAELAWQDRLAAYRKAYPDLAAELERRLRGELPAGWREAVAEFVRAAQESPRPWPRARPRRRCSTCSARPSPSCSVARRTSPFEQYEPQGLARGHRRRCPRQLPALRRA